MTRIFYFAASVTKLTNIMKYVEYILGTLCLVLGISRIFFSGSPGLFFLAATLLLFVYFFCSVFIFNDIGFAQMFRKETYRAIESKRTGIAIFSGVAYAIAVGAILFRVNRWPGSAFMLITAILPVIVTIILALALRSNPGKFYNGIMIRSALLLAIIIALFFARLAVRK